MTREEASFYLANMDRKYMEKGMSEALDMAIKALEQQPCEDIAEVTRRIVTEATEDMDNFIFTTIQPWCEEKIQRKILKYDLEQALMQYFNKQPCEDAVSRDLILKRIEESVARYSGQYTTDMLTMCGLFSQMIKELPSVTQKSGKWIGIDEEPHEDYECSCCGYVVSTFTANIEPHTEYKFCPNCGAKMFEPLESEE